MIVRFTVLFVAGFCAALAGAQVPVERAPEGESGLTRKPIVFARRHMAVTAHPLASAAALEILREGGSAADAAIAAQLVLNLVEPQSSGIGGGGFALYWDAKARRLHAYDARETAPASARPEDFLDPAGRPLAFIDAVRSGQAVGVPGIVALLDHMHRRHGRLGWVRLFEPAIGLASTGFSVSPRLQRLIADTPTLRERPDTRDYFFTPEGQPLPISALLRNVTFAATLRLLASEGPQPFYSGTIAASIIDAVRSTPRPGTIGRSDLSGYAVIERPPVCGPYRIYRVCGVGPPSSGGVAILQILMMLESFPSALVGGGDGEAAHLFLEATRLAFADRNLYVADPDFVRVPTQGLLDRAYLGARSVLIQRRSTMESVPAGFPPYQRGALHAPDEAEERSGTSHLSIVDGEGNAISFTTTIENAFGAQRMAAGFLLNNQLTDFSALAERDGRPVANRVEPGKRPRSSMAPIIVFDSSGTPVLLIGSPGGSRIIPFVARASLAVLDGGLDVQAAVNRPHVVTTGGATELELGTPIEALAPVLAAKGHRILARDLVSGLHAIVLRHGLLSGGADPRREGIARGD